jgi:hypothetical protein
MVFRTRAHQLECADAELNQQLLDVALATSNGYVAEQLKQKEE